MYKFKIESMNCMNCFQHIEEALKEAEGSVSAKADIKNKLLTVESKLPVNEIRKLIEAAGYEVNGVDSQEI